MAYHPLLDHIRIDSISKAFDSLAYGPITDSGDGSGSGSGSDDGSSSLLSKVREVAMNRIEKQDFYSEYIAEGTGVVEITEEQWCRWAKKNEAIRDLDISSNVEYRPLIGKVWKHWDLPILLYTAYAEALGFARFYHTLGSMTMCELFDSIDWTITKYDEFNIRVPKIIPVVYDKLRAITKILDPDMRFSMSGLVPRPVSSNRTVNSMKLGLGWGVGSGSGLAATQWHPMTKNRGPGSIIMVVIFAILGLLMIGRFL